MQAVDQAFDPQLLRTDAAQGRNGPMQHVIETAKIVGGLNRQDIVGLFDNANLRRVRDVDRGSKGRVRRR